MQNIGEAIRKNVNSFADDLGNGIKKDSQGGPALPDSVDHDTVRTTTQPGGTFGIGTHDRSGLSNSTTAAGDVHPDAKALGAEVEQGVDAAAAKLNKA